MPPELSPDLPADLPTPNAAAARDRQRRVISAFGGALGAAPRDFSVAKPLRMPTLMLVEDSRFACEVMRLYARALGLRLRRAGDLETAAAHLRLYQPDIVLIDLGLPDGRGEALIERLAQASPRPPLLMATSGQSDLRAGALAAGADIFIEKPLPDLASFRGLLVENYPSPLPLLLLPDRLPQPAPDRLALQDDLKLAAQTLSLADDCADTRLVRARTAYAAGLLDGVAGSTGDGALQDAARRELRAHDGTGQTTTGDLAFAAAQAQMGAAGQGFRRLRDLVNERLRDVMAEKGI